MRRRSGRRRATRRTPRGPCTCRPGPSVRRARRPARPPCLPTSPAGRWTRRRARRCGRTAGRPAGLIAASARTAAGERYAVCTLSADLARTTRSRPEPSGSVSRSPHARAAASDRRSSASRSTAQIAMSSSPLVRADSAVSRPLRCVAVARIAAMASEVSPCGLPGPTAVLPPGDAPEDLPDAGVRRGIGHAGVAVVVADAGAGEPDRRGAAGRGPGDEVGGHVARIGGQGGDAPGVGPLRPERPLGRVGAAGVVRERRVGGGGDLLDLGDGQGGGSGGGDGGGKVGHVGCSSCGWSGRRDGRVSPIVQVIMHVRRAQSRCQGVAAVGRADCDGLRYLPWAATATGGGRRRSNSAGRRTRT